MERYIRVANVSVDTENLLTREQMIDIAKTTKDFESNPNWFQEINAILDYVGLWDEVEPKKEEDGLHTATTTKDSKRKR
jgi:hypothetical protein